MNFSIKGYLETSFSDWPGKIASVLFLPSCNFRCPYCHNHRLALQPESYPDIPWPVIREDLEKRLGWIDGVCLTGGEPALHPWLTDLIREIRAVGGKHHGPALQVKLDTNGSRPEVLKRLISENLVDYVAMDVKAPLEAGRYHGITGGSPGNGAGDDEAERRIDAVRKSVEILLAADIDFEFRTTVVPGFIEEEEIYDLARRLGGAPRYTIQGFKPADAMSENLRALPPVPASRVEEMQRRVDEWMGRKPATRPRTAELAAEEARP
ncbi:MAG TPA: anaerobic ribonucleoside-triphosphate reductase activating protein [Thermodesulfobacteriota bacterium]|nr:anaerobic ribonucleoside-triphosphate reductase activating protein [Thermodesulfobacteriota bacterium]